MAGITLEQSQTMLDAFIGAAAAVATGQSYTIGGRSLTRANLSEINEAITYWENRVVKLSRGGIRITGAAPCG